MKTVLLHRCPHCGRYFDSPSFCMEGQCETEPVMENAPGPPPFAPVAITDNGDPVVCCEACGSTNLDFSGDDIDKCRDCRHWRYR